MTKQTLGEKLTNLFFAGFFSLITFGSIYGLFGGGYLLLKHTVDPTGMREYLFKNHEQALSLYDQSIERARGRRFRNSSNDKFLKLATQRLCEEVKKSGDYSKYKDLKWYLETENRRFSRTYNVDIDCNCN